MAMVENRAAGTEFPAAEIHFSRTVPATPPRRLMHMWRKMVVLTFPVRRYT